MGEIMEINGKKYAEIGTEGNHVAIVAERGWILEGYQTVREGGDVLLTGARVVRKWSNGLGLGGLVKLKHKDEYVLDNMGEVLVSRDAIIFTVFLEW